MFDGSVLFFDNSFDVESLRASGGVDDEKSVGGDD
jgi:hypothetical protein